MGSGRIGWLCAGLFCSMLLPGLLTAEDGALRLATTTSTENSGLLSHIHPLFTLKTGITVKVIATGTGASLNLAREGNVDVVLVHARAQEDEFIADGFGVGRCDVMYNDFVIIGPVHDPAGIKGTEDATDAMRKIHAEGQMFVSRGDHSGTHLKEQLLWQATGLPLLLVEREVLKKGKAVAIRFQRPEGEGYRSIGQGMGSTITYATEQRAYTISDRGTFYAFKLAKTPRTDLVILCEGDRRLHNPYGVIAVNPEKHPSVNHAAATAYIDWLTSPSVQQMIGSYTRSGKVLFHPAVGKTTVPERGDHEVDQDAPAKDPE